MLMFGIREFPHLTGSSQQFAGTLTSVTGAAMMGKSEADAPESSAVYLNGNGMRM